MSIFNSLGSNYTFSSALRMLFSIGGTTAREQLTTYLEKRYGGTAILTYKGREAISLALNSLPHGTVAINGFTCLAVYEAIVESGHRVQYLDIPNDGLNFTTETLQQALESNPAIKAVMIQNTLGIPCDMQGISALCKQRNIILIEDLAHSIGTTYESGEEAGTIGDFVILSFSQDKVVDAVSGGALIIRNKKYADTIVPPTKNVGWGQQLKDRFYPRFTWKIRAFYSWGIGRLFHRLYRKLGILSTPFGSEGVEARMLPGWYCANILRQYRVLEKTAKHRREIASVYAEHIDKRLQISGLQHSANLRFPILVPGRDRLIDHLKGAGVYVSDIWYDAPIAPKKYLHRTDYAGQCPHAEDISNRILNLPTHINVSHEQARMIAEIVNQWIAEEGANEYEVRAILDENVWEDFLCTQKPHSFLHSWKWGEHCKETGSKVFRIGVYQGETLVAVALFIKIDARRGSFLLCPHGPLIADTEHEERLLRVLTERCTSIATNERCNFIRFCPLTPASEKNTHMHKQLGFSDAPIHMHPELSWILDITKSEDDLVREMRKTTRYLVKKMEKEGVEITQSSDPNDIEKFWPIYQATVERQQFTPFGKEYLRKEFELFSKDNQSSFFFGTYKGLLCAAAIILFYNGQAFYHHSGSLSTGSNVSYLLQWRVIQEAKRRGCTLYNFWGISPADRQNHPWAGLSLFKKGFGGFAEEYLHAQDKPLAAKYALNYIIETARRIKRGL